MRAVAAGKIKGWAASPMRKPATSYLPSSRLRGTNYSAAHGAAGGKRLVLAPLRTRCAQGCGPRDPRAPPLPWERSWFAFLLFSRVRDGVKCGAGGDLFMSMHLTSENLISSQVPHALGFILLMVCSNSRSPGQFITQY